VGEEQACHDCVRLGGGGAGVCDDAHIGLSIKRNFGLDKVSFLLIFARAKMSCRWLAKMVV